MTDVERLIKTKKATVTWLVIGLGIVPLLLLLLASGANAADANETEAHRSSSSFPFDYFSDWFARVDRARAEQPHWPSPLATTVVTLKEALRYDISRQSLRDGHTLTSFGSGHGLEFIPAEHVQMIVGLPAWQTENTVPRKEGFADQTFLLKYRLRSANEENGNYIVTAMLRPVVLNTTAQYHLASIFWPELEVNYTYWPNGRHEGLNQVFITPGLALYKFHIWKRSDFVVAAGCQLAVTDHALYHRSFILSASFPF